MGWSLERKAFRLFWVLLPFCPFWWRIDSKKKISEQTLEERRARWVIGWLVPLVAFWLINPAPCLWKGMAAFFALYRLLEILVTGLGTALNQLDQARARSLVTIGFYAVQMTLIFAILYHTFAPTDFVEGGPLASTPASSPLDYAYISWTNITSLGNAYQPEGNPARLLEALTTTSGIFLLGVLLAFGIDATKSNRPDQ
jgi:hypothetical protein